MNEDLNIINSNRRIEKIKNFIIKNKKLWIVVILLIIFILCSYIGYGEVRKRNKIKLADSYNISVIKFKSGDQKNTKKELIRIIEEKDKTYSLLALYFLIDNNIISQNDRINELFDKIIDETKLEIEIKNLVIFKKALFNSDFENENEIIKILNPIINSESIWKGHSLFLLGEYFLNKNEKNKAREFFEQILILKNVNPDIRIETQKRLNRDLSE